MAQIYSVIQTSSSAGMKTLEQHLDELVEEGLVSPVVASQRIALVEEKQRKTNNSSLSLSTVF